MPRDKDLLGIRSGRDESPEVELIIQQEIGNCVAQALCELGIYQKSQINFDRIDAYLKQISSTTELEFFKKEFSKRPWIPITQGLSEDKAMRSQYFCGVGDSGLNCPLDEMNLSFPLPSINTWCSSCKSQTTFDSVGSIWCDGFIDFFPKLSDKTEQMFTFYYQCSLCKSNIISFLLKRAGCILHLCGRSERLSINVSKLIPKKLRPIVEDAIGSVNENDIFAGFYHLRTFVEHYMKSCLTVTINKRISGEELSELYNSSLDNRMTSGMPSMSLIYENASKFMHSRTGTRGDFHKLLGDVEAHLQAKDLFSKYAIA